MNAVMCVCVWISVHVRLCRSMMDESGEWMVEGRARDHTFDHPFSLFCRSFCSRSISFIGASILSLFCCCCCSLCCIGFLSVHANCIAMHCIDMNRFVRRMNFNMAWPCARVCYIANSNCCSLRCFVFLSLSLALWLWFLLQYERNIDGIVTILNGHFDYWYCAIAVQ